MPVVTYPGVTGVKQLEGTNPVGITPGQFVLLVYAGSVAAETGTLVIGDGVNAGISFHNCFRQYDDVVTDGGKKYRTVRLLDRRYRLMMGHPVRGHWNQVDERKKLIPWTVASPHQLATMLAAAMGETLLATDLPGGLAQPLNAPLGIPAPGPLDTLIRPGGEFYRCGTNSPVTNTNPVEFWNGQPAAVAMQNLCERYGRVFCPDPTQIAVSTIWAIGSGAAIPAGGVVVSDDTSITADPKPARVDVFSSPTRYTVRVRLRNVVPEWDGTWVPTERASYAPARAGQKMRCVASLKGAFDATRIYGLTLNERHYQSVAPANLAAALTALNSALNGDGDPRRDGITSTVVGSTLEIDHPLDGVEYELTTEGSSVALAGNWVVDCTRCPITGPRDGQPVYETTFVGAWVAGTTFTVTIDAVPFTSDIAAVSGNAALADLVTQVDASGLSVTAEWAPGKLLVTGNTPGTAITVTASSTGLEVVTTTEVAGTTFTPKGWEKVYPSAAAGYLSVATTRLSLDQAKRLTNEHLCRTYQVVTEDPRPRPDGAFPPVPDKEIPVPGYPDSPVDNRHRLVLQNTRPEPVHPAPESISVFDVRTAQPYAMETYNGYATDRPNVAYGSVAPWLMASSGLVWRGGSYLGNTPLRQRLPFPFRVIDPQHQVVQFDRQLFRMLGIGADAGFLPAELVIEVGCTVLEPGTSAPASYTVSVFPGGPGPAIMRVFSDVEDEVAGDWDGYHGVTGWRFLNQVDAGNRATEYANAVAATFQTAAGVGRRYSGILNVPTDGKTRVVNWVISGDSLQTAVGVNCETSRLVRPLAARRRDENLPADAVRGLQNLDTDFKRSGGFANAMNWYNSLTKGTQ